MAVSGRKIGGAAGALVPVAPVDGIGPVTCGVDGVDVAGVPAGGRMTKHAGPALRWLACAAVGLPVVFT